MESEIKTKISLLNKDDDFLNYINLLIDNKMKENNELYNKYFIKKVNNERLIKGDKKFLLLIHKDCYGERPEVFGIFKSPNKEFLIQKIKYIYSSWDNNDIFEVVELKPEFEIDLLDINNLNSEKIF